MKALKVAVVVAIAFSCSKDKDPNTVDSEFQPYVDSFNKEAISRNIDVDEGGLIVGFVDQSEIPNYCGQGTFNPPHVKISETPTCWSSATDINKEILFFHEMGHAVLRRVHINDTLPNGDYKSMMFDGNQFNLYGAQDEQRRNYYLDELFNPGTPAPAWAAKKTNAQSYYSTAFDNNSLGNWFFENNGANITGTVEDGTVKLSGGSNPSEGFAYWAISFNPDSDIPIGSRVVLKVKIRIDAVTGPGVYIALRGNTDQPTVFFQTTQNKITINGTADFKEYSIAQPYFPSAIKSLQIYLILDGKASGSVQFDDVELLILQ
jgi:hypothetical protein